MTYVKEFATENEAMDRMRLKNRASRAAGNRRDTYAVVDGPLDNWAVVDLRTAIDIGTGYRIEE